MQEGKSQDDHVLHFFFFLGAKPATIPHHLCTREAWVIMLHCARPHRLGLMIRQSLDNHSTVGQSSLPTAGLQLADLAVYLSILFVVSLIVGKLKSAMLSHETLKAG